MAFDPSNMNPYSIGTGIAGLGVEIYGGIESAKYAKQAAEISKQEAGTEMQQENVRQSAMHMSGQRQMLQQVRNNQMARSQALATANAEGAQKGSGLAGAYGSISGQTSTNLAGISQNLQFGDRMFELNRQLDSLKMSEADVKGRQATATGISSIGAGIMGLGKSFG